MNLGIRSPVKPLKWSPIPAQSFTPGELLSGDPYSSATDLSGSTLAALTYGASPEKVYKFTNFQDITSNTITSLPAHMTHNNVIVYNSTDGLFYILGGIVNGGVGPWQWCVATYNSATNATAMLIDQRQVGTTGKSVSDNCAMATDGTYLYAISTSTAENSWVYKFRCSDGATVASIHLGNTPGGNPSRRGNSLMLVGSTLYMAGQVSTGTTGWFGTIDTGLISATLIDGPSLYPGNMFEIGSDIWVTDLDTEFIGKVASDLSTSTTYSWGSGAQTYSAMYDGKFIIGGYVVSATQDNETLRYMDPASGSVLFDWTVPNWLTGANNTWNGLIAAQGGSGIFCVAGVSNFQVAINPYYPS